LVATDHEKRVTVMTATTLTDLYEVKVEPNVMLGMCRWTKNGHPISGAFVPADVLHDIASRLRMERKAS
jgi:hypothetical protein